MKYRVTFTIGGCVTVDAETKLEAEEDVEDMSSTELLSYADFEIQSVKEVTE